MSKCVYPEPLGQPTLQSLKCMMAQSARHGISDNPASAKNFGLLATATKPAVPAGKFAHFAGSSRIGVTVSRIVTSGAQAHIENGNT